MTTYDQKCFDLALRFLADVTPSLTEPELNKLGDSLAKQIQLTIEDFLQEECDPKPEDLEHWRDTYSALIEKDSR